MASHDSIHLREYELSVEHQQTGEEVSHNAHRYRSLCHPPIQIIRIRCHPVTQITGCC